MSEPAKERPRVGVVMGSRSDWDTLQHAAATLADLGIAHDVRVVSAHRTPDLLFEYAEAAIDRLALHEAIAAIWTLVETTNGYLTQQEPWKVAKDPAEVDASGACVPRGRLATILVTAGPGAPRRSSSSPPRGAPAGGTSSP